MNAWLIAALALLPGLLVCGIVAFVARAIEGLVALELASSLAVAELMLLSEGTGRQPFVDLALVLAALGLIGSLAFARLMEHGP